MSCRLILADIYFFYRQKTIFFTAVHNIKNRQWTQYKPVGFASMLFGTEIESFCEFLSVPSCINQGDECV